MLLYWIKHRLLFSMLVILALGLVVGALLVFPYIAQEAVGYNEQSLYKNTSVDFVVPEPSIQQINDLPGTNGIDKVFPYIITKKKIEVNGLSRDTNVLLSDRFENIDITMYNSSRLIEESKKKQENPIWIDWEFYKDTGVKIGDEIPIAIGGEKINFHVSAIYETNSYYDNGAIIAQVDSDVINKIITNATNNGYSAMFVAASDYDKCKIFLTSDYRPLGRLKDRSIFDDEEQYTTHYNAIMKSGYGNEITDFRIKEGNADNSSNNIFVMVGAVLSFVVIMAFNIVMAKRGCEKGYFTKLCIPKGINVKPYYSISLIAEMLFYFIAFFAGLCYRIYSSSYYFPRSIFNFRIIIVVPLVILSELICKGFNNSMVNGIIKRYKKEKERQEKSQINSGSPS